jgi:hypothetical protein
LSANLSTNNIGTFGQYSVGVSGQIKDSGWLGFVRVDYRDGSEMHGLSGTGGIRVLTHRGRQRHAGEGEGKGAGEG